MKSIKFALSVFGLLLLSLIYTYSSTAILAESESPLDFKMNSIDGEEIKSLSKDVGTITKEDAEAIGHFIAEEIDMIIEPFEKH